MNEPSSLDYLLGSIAAIVYVSLEAMREIPGAEDSCKLFAKSWHEIERRVKRMIALKED